MQAIVDAAADPLIAALALVVTGVVVSHVLFRKYALGRAIVRIVFLIFLTFVLLRADIIPYQPLEPTGELVPDVVHAVLKIAWWLWAAWFLVGIVHAFLVVERSPHEGKLVQDLLAGLIYLAALFAIATYVFDLSITGMLATSGVIAIILGLALQSTLGAAFPRRFETEWRHAPTCFSTAARTIRRTGTSRSAAGGFTSPSASSATTKKSGATPWSWRGGEYFFMPSLSALKWLADLDAATR